MTAPRPPQPPAAAPAWDTVEHRARPLQGWLVSIGLLALAPALFATGLRLFPPSSDRAALLASFIPYGLLGYFLATPCLLIAFVRARGARVLLGIIALLTVAGLVYQLSALLPLYLRDDRAVTTAPFTLISLNMRAGASDPVGLARQAENADIVVLVEATTDGVAALQRYGWNDRFPHASGSTEEGEPGSVIYSRFPLSEGRALPPSSFQQWAATADVPEIGPVRILAVHPCNPYCGGGKWASEHADLNQFAEAQRTDRPLIVAGDFNAIDDHGPMMALYRAGMKSTTDVAGGGWLPTYPANSRVPPLLPIDHVLINDHLTATEAGTFRLGGTDHLGLQVVLAGTS